MLYSVAVSGSGGSADGDLAAGRVEREPAALDDPAVLGARAALERPDAGQQLPEVEGLDQVVVGARVQAADPVRRRIAGRQHEEGRRSPVCLRAQATTSMPSAPGIRQSRRATSYS